MEKLYSNVMESLFKMDFVEEMVETVEDYAIDWWDQLQLLQEQWLYDVVGTAIKSEFLQNCSRLALPGEQCDLPAAVSKARTLWKNELVLAAADMIIRQHYRLPRSVTVIRFNEGELEVNMSVLEQHVDITDVDESIKL